MNVPQQMNISGMTFDPNNANVRALQAQRPHDWMQAMAASQGLQNAGPQNVQPVMPDMTPKAAAFRMLLGTLEKEANPLAKMLSGAAQKVGPALQSAGNAATAFGKNVATGFARPAAPTFGSAGMAAGQAARNLTGNVAGAASSAGKMLAGAPEATGKFLTNTTRRAGNLMDPAGQAGSKITEFLGANNRAGNYANKVIGGGALAIGANKMLGGGGEDGGANNEAMPMAAGAGAVGAAPAADSAAGGGGLMGMWNSMPVEMRYAIGAGVPLALAGGLMGMRGNTGAGLGLGALGLGGMALGAAGSGYLGEGARRMVGQGANALYNMVGGGNNGDLRGQLNALKGLSPEFGTTMLMGRDPNLTSQQARGAYDFLTTNPAIESFLPGITNASVRPSAAVKAGAMIAKKMAESDGRCWKGYEAVPGVKPFSRGSCRPVNAQKSTNSPKPVAAGDDTTNN